MKKKVRKNRRRIAQAVNLDVAAEEYRLRTDNDDILKIFAQIAMRVVERDHLLRHALFELGLFVRLELVLDALANFQRDAIEPGAGRRLFTGEPDIFDFRNAVIDDLAIIICREHLTGQDSVGLVQGMAGEINLAEGPGQIVFRCKFGTIGQIGDSVAELLQNGDAGVVQIVVRPFFAAEFLQHGDTRLSQGIEIETVLIRDDFFDVFGRFHGLALPRLAVCLWRFSRAGDAPDRVILQLMVELHLQLSL